jgi:hypothetical protein
MGLGSLWTFVIMGLRLLALGAYWPMAHRLFSYGLSKPISSMIFGIYSLWGLGPNGFGSCEIEGLVS